MPCSITIDEKQSIDEKLQALVLLHEKVLKGTSFQFKFSISCCCFVFFKPKDKSNLAFVRADGLEGVEAEVNGEGRRRIRHSLSTYTTYSVIP